MRRHVESGAEKNYGTLRSGSISRNKILRCVILMHCSRPRDRTSNSTVDQAGIRRGYMDQVAFRNAKGFDVKYKVVAIRAHWHPDGTGLQARLWSFLRSENAFRRPSTVFNHSNPFRKFLYRQIRKSPDSRNPSLTKESHDWQLAQNYEFWQEYFDFIKN